MYFFPPPNVQTIGSEKSKVFPNGNYKLNKRHRIIRCWILKFFFFFYQLIQKLVITLIEAWREHYMSWQCIHDVGHPWKFQTNECWMGINYNKVSVRRTLWTVERAALAVGLMCVITNRVITVEIRHIGRGTLQKGRKAWGSDISEKECGWFGHSLDVEISSVQENEL